MDNLPIIDKETSLPISQPLKTVEQVLAWKPGADPFCVSAVPMKPRKKLFANKPKTLVCHDMQGGYREDRFTQGFNSNTCYRINHWNFIDTFVYFSHNIVTIPPPCWTNACHRHGVKVLGTFITEWDDGVQHCSKIFASELEYKEFAEQLVAISAYYQFDGWLINIENVIAESRLENLLGFVRFLTESMHAAVPGSEVIWYDSVTDKGLLNWQNELNASNSLYFDSCDGIFLNYTWSVEQLSNSSLHAGESRKFDVYVGVDCFGRGCFGGGGWDTYQALQVIRQHDLSAAIFAPGWVLETQGKEKFTTCQNRFWSLLLSYLYPHVVTELPLISSFCQGYGCSFFLNGHRVIESPWTNLSFQQLQPTYFDKHEEVGAEGGFEIKDISYHTKDGYQGGGCIAFEGVVEPQIQESAAVFSLFTCDCEVRDPLFVALTFKLDRDDLMGVHLMLSMGTKPKCIVLSVSQTEETAAFDEKTLKVGNYELSTSRLIDNRKFEFSEVEEDDTTAYEPLKGESHSIASKFCKDGTDDNGWQTRYYIILQQDSSALKNVKLACATKYTGFSAVSPFTLMLGEIKIMPLKQLFPVFPCIASIRNTDTVNETSKDNRLFSTTISWHCESKDNTPFVPCSFNIYSTGITVPGHNSSKKGVLLGRACVNMYRVAQLQLHGNETELSFLIQPVSDCNIAAPEENCAKYTIRL